jgi:hypothetical protein
MYFCQNLAFTSLSAIASGMSINVNKLASKVLPLP